jgi:hypothetical protein
MRNSEVKLVVAEEEAEAAAAAAAAQECACGAGTGGESGGAAVETEGGNAPKRSARGKRASMVLSFANDENSGSGKDNGNDNRNGKDSASGKDGANPNQGELRTLNADRNKLDSAMVAQLQAFQQQLDDKAAHRAKDWAQLLTASQAAKETVWGEGN